ncbi:hypothetical protein AW942_17295 [Pseudomonas aeruginosa]|nr:hypothetical protein AW897_17125 [Pseudomonas aeruginosa]OFO84500.1 hypothetical protein HMPREF3014_25480 [Pseudomonas sp. HMSC065H01]OFR05967.1 hypothetical protein HMPREF2906_27690 [Pseudomonas sp. HMSC065H02]KXC83199.1 hypothetical protein AW899_18165 [Pseudomonas aeruginosa]KXC94904.1 hypothetical protein AW898_17135 [Pseudomonas aeruginosa]
MHWYTRLASTSFRSNDQPFCCLDVKSMHLALILKLSEAVENNRTVGHQEVEIDLTVEEVDFHTINPNDGLHLP